MSEKLNIESLNKLGSIRHQIAVLKAEEAELSLMLKPQFEDGQVIETGSYRFELVVRNDRVLDQKEVCKKLGQKKFLSLAKIGVTELKKVMGAEDIDACTREFKPVRVLDIDPINKGGESLQPVSEDF